MSRGAFGFKYVILTPFKLVWTHFVVFCVFQAILEFGARELQFNFGGRIYFLLLYFLSPNLKINKEIDQKDAKDK